MSELVVAVDDVKAHFLGCSILILQYSDHAKKQMARGEMALKGALDCEYRAEKEGHDVVLGNTIIKDAEPPQDMFFGFTELTSTAQLSARFWKPPMHQSDNANRHPLN
ncbi:hypothetical protein [uncultured Sulfitobacter sp.]|uniref:hypothetical protein n=1 Tax=uncultured Sulfitobacter sp. TaxID=191468 RepID=UPI0026163781|nr:hypothetical protein [uncultured Sulfitobacter sp.]